MDASADLAEFLATRRAAVTPEQAGLPVFGRRQVPGLRREEVASLAGVSAEYYRRLERGNASGASESVLEAIASALQLDDVERAHLFDLARSAAPLSAPRRARKPAAQRVRPTTLRILDTLGSPAVVRNSRGDYLAANPLGRALLSPVFESTLQPPNSARFCFLDRAAQDFYVEWERLARELVATLRAEAGRNPYDKGLTDLIGELSTRSEPFRKWWAAHDVRAHRAGTKTLRHPVVGEIELDYEVMGLTADNGLAIAVYSPQPASRSAEALALLASWAAAPAGAPEEA